MGMDKRASNLEALNANSTRASLVKEPPYLADTLPRKL
jgi:hypothetical protein